MRSMKEDHHDSKTSLASHHRFICRFVCHNNRLSLTHEPALVALLWGLHQTFWLLVGLALLAVGIKLLLHTRRPHAALTSRFLGSLPGNGQLALVAAINLLGGALIDLYLY